MNTKIYLTLTLVFTLGLANAQNTNHSKFKQLGQELPTPNVYRTASGAPGPNYYQQKADYVISLVLDDEKQTIHGEERITYTNNSPDPLSYLWVQLDQNMRAINSDTKKMKKGKIPEKITPKQVEKFFYELSFYTFL